MKSEENKYLFKKTSSYKNKCEQNFDENDIVSKKLFLDKTIFKFDKEKSGSLSNKPNDRSMN